MSFKEKRNWSIFFSLGNISQTSNQSQFNFPLKEVMTLYIKKVMISTKGHLNEVILCSCDINYKYCCFTALYPLTLTLALIGKLGAASAFGLIYVLSAEIFPTVVRNSAMGACSCVSRIGGMLAPYVAKLVNMHLYNLLRRFCNDYC